MKYLINSFLILALGMVAYYSGDVTTQITILLGQMALLLLSFTDSIKGGE